MSKRFFHVKMAFMWVLYSVLSIISYTTSSIFAKKSTLEDGGNNEWTLILYANIISALYFVIFNISSISEGGLSSLTTIVKYPLTLTFLIPSLLCTIFEVLAVKVLPLSKCSPLLYLSAVLAFFATLILFLLTGIDLYSARYFTPLRTISLILIFYAIFRIYLIEKSEVEKEEGCSTSGKLLVVGYIFVFIAVLSDALDVTASSFVFATTDITEGDVIAFYGLSSLFASICIYAYLSIKERKLFNIFNIRKEKNTILFGATSFAAFSTYTLAQSLSPILAPILIFSAAIFEMSAGLLFFKEKLSRNHFIVLLIVIMAIILFGISEVI